MLTPSHLDHRITRLNNIALALQPGPPPPNRKNPILPNQHVRSYPATGEASAGNSLEAREHDGTSGRVVNYPQATAETSSGSLQPECEVAELVRVQPLNSHEFSYLTLSLQSTTRGRQP